MTKGMLWNWPASPKISARRKDETKTRIGGVTVIATQDYGWSQHAVRTGRTWPEATDWAMGQAASAGFTAWEPLLASPEDAQRVGNLARLHGLSIPSIFVTGALHDPGAAAATEARFLTTLKIASGFGCRQVMVYPSPLPGNAGKSDAELVFQSGRLDFLGRLFQAAGVQLCYHPEDVEMHFAAREFHHMLIATEPAVVGLCLDADTIWRGTGFSKLAVMDIIALYGLRVTALHLRQSRAGVWDEVLGPGDLDYSAILTALVRLGAKPSLIVELALENATPVTMDPAAAHQQSLAYAREWLMPLLGAA